MKRLGLLAAGLTLLVLGAEPAPIDKANAPLLPGFPDVKYNARLLEPLDKNNKPVLKIVGQPLYNPDLKIVIWLVELQTDIGFEELRSISSNWYGVGASNGPSAFSGPSAYFFDKDGVALSFRDLKLLGKLNEGKKGDRIRVYLEVQTGVPPAAAYLEIRRSEASRRP